MLLGRLQAIINTPDIPEVGPVKPKAMVELPEATPELWNVGASI
jgi:hypothetical protein